MAVTDSPVTTTPSVSAAEALAATPFFASLDAVEIARLVPELEERQLQPGQPVYCQGDPPDGLYLIRSGTAEVTVTTENGAQSVHAMVAPAYFGETALLTDEPRAADVVARTSLSLWKLPRERFDELVKEHPRLPLEIAAKLASRLTETTHKLSRSQEQVTLVARAAYGSLDPPAQAMLRRSALFPEFDVELLKALLGPAWSDESFERLREEEVFFQAGQCEGWFRFTQASVRGFLLHQLQAELGTREMNRWRCRAADLLLAREDASPAEALELLRAAEDWRRLGKILEERGHDVAKEAPERVEGYLRALPERQFWPRPGLVCLLAECCAAQGKLEQAIDAYREAERRDPSACDGTVGLTYQRALAGLYERVGEQDESIACLRRAQELETHAGPIGERDDGNAQLQTDLPHAAEQAEHRRDEAALGAIFQGWAFSWRWLATIAILAVTALAWVVPPPAGLSPAGLQVLATVAALVALSFLDVLPDYLLGVLMIAAWVVTGTLPPAVAASGFASSTWFLMLGAMAIGAAVERSGILYRGAIEIVRHLPAKHAVRCLTLGGLGVLFSPGMPSLAARIMLAMPLTQDIADSLRYPERSRGSAGLALATYVGFGYMGTLFLTGAPNCLILYGLLPPDVQARMSWGSWFVAALPTHLVLFGLSMAFLLFWYRPEHEDGVPEQTLALQRRVLGRLSRDEWIALTVVGLLLVGFSTQSIHHVDPAWIAVAAIAVLFLAGALDEGGFANGVKLSFLLYVGVIMGFGEIFNHVELQTWLSQNFEGLAGLSRGSPTLFVMIVAAVGVILSLILRPGPIAILLALALYQTAAAIGVSPWIVALTVMLSTNIWIYPQQNILYLTAYYASGERAFTHAQARPLAIAYTAAIFVALLVSIPYWRWLGLIG